MSGMDCPHGFASVGNNRLKKVSHRSAMGIPESMTMFNDTGLPKSALNDTDSGGQPDAEALAAGPPRFGRLAMCVAAVSALATGVMGTVAYSVWFNQDQQAYAEAMAGAQRALGSTASATMAATADSANAAPPPATPVLAKSPAPPPAANGTMKSAPASVSAPELEEDPEQGGPLASWSGQVTGHSAPTAQVAAVADATTAASASAGVSAPYAANPSNPPAQQLASARPGKDGHALPQERRAAYTNARHKDSLFARVGQFLRRVSYRQHGNASRQDTYSHP